MANDFSGDANCVALWNLENGALTTDSIGGNTLTNNNVVVADVVNYKQGAASGDFELGSTNWLDITDASLDADFPLKNGDTTKTMSVCFWVRFESLTTTDALVSKFTAAADKRSFHIVSESAADKLRLVSGYNNGASSEDVTYGTGFATGIWYHCGITLDGVAKSYRLRVWDDNAGALLDSDTTGSFGNETSATTSDLMIGTSRAATRRYHDGLMDEVVVFKDILSADEIDDIRRGIYGRGTNDFSGDANCVALWNMDAGGITVDAKGGNTLTDNNTCGTDGADYKQGDQCVDFEAGQSEFLGIADADLDAGFPLKNGDSVKKISVCQWVKFESINANRPLVAKYNKQDGKRTLIIQLVAADEKIYLHIGIAPGTSLESIAYGTACVTGRWYHVGVTLDGVAKTYRIRIWDDTAGALLDSDTAGTATNEINVEDAPFEIGSYWSTSSRTTYADQRMDEVVIFKDILTAAEIDEIRQGIYGAAPAGVVPQAYMIMNVLS